MGENSKIEWTTHTFNPWRGCTKISPGCTHCYAEGLSHRNPKVLGVWGDQGTRVVASEAAWREPLKWDREAAKVGERRRVFCASLADVFEDRPELVEPRGRLFGLIDRTLNLDWLLLTKRPESIRSCLERIPIDISYWGSSGLSWWQAMYDHAAFPDNLWLGVSVENRKDGFPRVARLREIPCAVRFLSVEPLLEDLGRIDLTGIGWVIVGGESGPHARPMHPDWVRSVCDQCQAAGVPFFFKQWGEWANIHNCGHIALGIDRGDYRVGEWHGDGPFTPGCICGSGHGTVVRVGKKAAGRTLDGRLWDEFPAPAGSGVARA